MEDAEPSDDVEMVVNVVMSFLLIGGALLLHGALPQARATAPAE